MKRILIVDDEIEMQKLLKLCIQSSSYDIRTLSSAIEAELYLNKEDIHLILLDIMMPEMTGFEFLKNINELQKEIPVILITAMDDTGAVVKGLELGAYDFITKPFEPRELKARVQSVIKRTEHLFVKDTVISRFGIKRNPSQRIFTYNEQVIPFTNKEYQLFSRFFQYPGRVYTRDQLLTLEWEEEEERFNRNVDVHIKHIRDKLAQAGIERPLIETVWGVGYKMPLEELD
ncbi:response regulator transcription factor [Alkalihalophilus marmarensis]|uniref:response regulator transcription factor n=1 Tax=Alkalihalophilus marmarensis TaxID=521377 RepID=UPI002DB9EB3F|nr:response regulator transcription factor [Alkalihalophilus marmarensis]MEC2072761.1 response regulator transcription factor [Alkalihalophilus marmarensis]